MKIWTCGICPRSGSRNAWTRIKNVVWATFRIFSARSKWSPVGRYWWQWMKRGVLLISAGAIEGHFEGKTPQEGHQGCLVLARQSRVSPGTCIPEEIGLPGLPVSWSSTLFSESGPDGLLPVLWTEKTIDRSLFFYPTRRSLLPRRPGWTDKFPVFFSGLQKLEQRAKKSIQLHREYVDYIPSLVAVACFLPGRAKNLLATPRLISLTAFRYAEVYWTHGALAKSPHWLVSKWQWGSRSVSGRSISLSTKSLSPVALSTMFCIRLTGWHVLPQHPVLCSAETLSVVALSNLFCVLLTDCHLLPPAPYSAETLSAVALSNLFCVLLTGCHLLPSAPCSVSYWQTVACCPSTLFCVLLTRSHLLPPAPCSVFCWQPVYSELESLPELTS